MWELPSERSCCFFPPVPCKCPDLLVYLKARGKFQRSSQQGNAAFFIWVIHIISERLLSQARLAVCCCLKSLAIWDYTKHLLKTQKIFCATLENVIKVRLVVCILHKKYQQFPFLSAFMAWLTKAGRQRDIPWLATSLSDCPMWSLKHMVKRRRGIIPVVVTQRGREQSHPLLLLNPLCSSWWVWEAVLNQY